jgi:hypothetical protein
MKAVWILSFVFFSSLHVLCQEFNAQEWIGKYAGIMQLTNTTGMNDEVAVEFEFKEVTKDSVWTYRMCYKSEKYGEMVKDYRIIQPADSLSNNFKLDELDGIIIDMTYFNNTFFSLFEVLGTIHTCSMALENDTIRFEMFGGSLLQPTSVTSSIPEGDDNESFKVTSYKPTYQQKVNLKRIE